MLVAALLCTHPHAASQGAAPAAGRDCEAQAIVGIAGSARETPKLIACSRLLTEVPALRAAVDRLNAALSVRSAADDERLRSIEKMLRQLNEASRQLPVRLTSQFAASFARQFDTLPAGGSDEQLIRQVDRMRLDLEEVQETTRRLAAQDSGIVKVREAYDGDAGAALARFEFRKAVEILDRLTRIEAKIDRLGNPPQAAPLLQVERREVDTWLQSFRTLGGPQRCPGVDADVAGLLRESESTAAAGQAQGARELLSGVFRRLMTAVGRLRFEDMQVSRAQADHAREQAQASRDLAALNKRIGETDAVIERTLRDQAKVVADRFAGQAQEKAYHEARIRELNLSIEKQQREVLDALPQQREALQAGVERTRAEVQGVYRDITEAERKFAAEQKTGHWPESPASYFETEFKRRRDERSHLAEAQALLTRTLQQNESPAAGTHAQAALALREARQNASHIQRGQPLETLRANASPGIEPGGCY